MTTEPKYSPWDPVAVQRRKAEERAAGITPTNAAPDYLRSKMFRARYEATAQAAEEAERRAQLEAANAAAEARKAHARRAFLEAGGLPAEFDAAWPEIRTQMAAQAAAEAMQEPAPVSGTDRALRAMYPKP